jgi:hypothetical protein
MVHGEVAYPEEEPDDVPALVGAGVSGDDGPDDPFLDTAPEVVSD